MRVNQAAHHDGYAAGYDEQAAACECHVADLLFGLCYEFTRPGQRLLDAGIGTGLSARLFARSGLEVHGMDFSPAMLAQCQAKGVAATLTQHDLSQLPWPQSTGEFDHLVCCGVLHFMEDAEPVIAEARRVLRPGGVFGFTTQLPASGAADGVGAEQHDEGGFTIFAHSPGDVRSQLARHGLVVLKTQQCLVGGVPFQLWVTGSPPHTL